MTANKDAIWNIILIISILLIIQGMPHIGDKDKKAAQAAQGETAIGTAGAVAFAFKKQILWTWPIVGLILGGALVAPKVFTGWIDAFKNIFAPTPTIPGYVWIGAFLVIMFLIISRKRQ